MAMQTVFDRADSLDDLASALAGFGPRVAQDLEKLLAPGLAPGQTLPDLELTQQLIVQAAERPFETLRQAELAMERAEDDEDADVVAGLFRLAGHGRMARGFKPSRQHKGRTLADVKRLQKRRARQRGREEEKVEAFAGAREEGSRNAEALDGVREVNGETPPPPMTAGDGDAQRLRPSRRPRAWLRFASRRRGRSFRDLPASRSDSRDQNDSGGSQGLLHRVLLRLARPEGRL